MVLNLRNKIVTDLAFLQVTKFLFFMEYYYRWVLPRKSKATIVSFHDKMENTNDENNKSINQTECAFSVIYGILVDSIFDAKQAQIKFKSDN